MGNSPQEPSALARQGARQVRDIFLALVQEGFTEGQALVIIGQIMAAQALGGDGGADGG